MLLTLSKPAKSEFEYKTHDYPTLFSSSASAPLSPKFKGKGGHFCPLPAPSSSTMGTPHRGLPPPSAMTLPDPGRGQPMTPSLGSLPPAPSQWQGAEDGMKNWLLAKTEEDKRKQEEEKTRQEGLRLEQRKIEQAMLRESMQAGVPPHLVPMIFAGIGGGNLAHMSADWIQQYTLQLQSSQQQLAPDERQAQLSPELRRETRLIGQVPPGLYGATPQTPQSGLPPAPVLPGQSLHAQPQHAAFSSTPYAAGNVSPRARAAHPLAHAGAPTSAPRPPLQSQLPRLTTNEMHIQQPPAAPSNVQQHQQPAPVQQEQSSPSIYFHHWVPPTSQQEKSSSSGNPPATPSGKYKASPSFPPRQRAASHASDPDYTSSPKKRKAQGGHAAQPPPTSAPQSYASPSFSHISTSSTSTPGRRGHGRVRSDASTRGADAQAGQLSRRSTMTSHGYNEAGVEHADSTEYRFAPPTRRAESPHQQQLQQHESTYVPLPQRNDGRGIGQHARPETPIAIQTETRQSGQHPQGQGSVHTSPKQEQ